MKLVALGLGAIVVLGSGLGLAACGSSSSPAPGGVDASDAALDADGPFQFDSGPRDAQPEAAAPVFCKGLTVDFCNESSGPTPGAGWDGVDARGGGAVSLVAATETSKPFALKSTLPAITTGSNAANAQVAKKIALAGKKKITISLAANIGTAVVLYPVLRRQSEALSLGYVIARTIESVFIAAGILCVLGVVSLGQDDPGADSLAVSLAAIKDWTFLLGPGMVVGLGNGLILGWLMFRSGLVPRGMAVLGMVGGPVLLAAGIGVLFGVIEPGGTVQSLATAPEFVWELWLGIYLTVVGFRRVAPSPGVRDAVAEPQPA